MEKGIHREMFNDEELKKLSPTLFGLSRENPFAVPDGYFNSLSEQVVQQIQSVPDFERVANENPFVVPDDYFNSLTVTIQQRISEEKSRRIRWREKLPEIGYSLFGEIRFAPALAFASVALLLVFGVKYMTRTVRLSQDSPVAVSANDISSPEITTSELNSSGYLSEIDESMIVEQLGNKVIASEPANDKSEEDYLINNDIDVSTIADQL